MTALSKVMIVDDLCQEIGLNRRDAKALVNAFFDEIQDALIQGEGVKLSGFGNFNLRDKSERPGRNPKTGEEIPVKARRVVTFKQGLKLKKKLENATQE